MLNNQTIDELITNLIKHAELGEVIVPIWPVSGGFMHRMYRVETDSGVYAVKHLNPQIMSRETAHDNFKRAESIEAILEKEDIPLVPALVIAGRKMQCVDGQYFYLFHWQEGQITDWNHISKGQCAIAGNILGRMHRIEPRQVPHDQPQVSAIDWQSYVQKAKEQQSEIAGELAENVSLLTYAEEQLNLSRVELPDICCISNGDMDPKNVMWHEGQPWVIDLECLDYGNPVSHVMELALQWSGVTTCNIEIEKVQAFLEGYLAAYDNGFRAYGSVFGLAYTWVEWLEYNINRALGACMDEAERQMGITEVRETIRRIAHIREKETDIKEELERYFQER